MRVRDGEHLAGARVLHDIRARVNGRNACLRGPGEQASRPDRYEERAPHRSRIFSPMKSDVEETFGFSRSSVATGTPLFVEITP